MSLPRASTIAFAVLLLAACSGCGMTADLAPQPVPTRTTIAAAPVTGPLRRAATAAYLQAERAAWKHKQAALEAAKHEADPRGLVTGADQCGEPPAHRAG